MRAPISIPKIPPPAIEDFYRLYIQTNTPVVITGLADNWPAKSNWSIPYFAKNYGHVNAGSITLQGGHCVINTERGSLLQYATVKECIASIEAGKLDNGWAIASPVEDFPATLTNDFEEPIYCVGGKFLRKRVFIGPAGVITALHQDLYENLYVMVKGKKRITLFPPRPTSVVYPYSRFSKFPNGSQIDPENADYERFPKMKDAQPWVVDLVAGETLLIPAFWWHHLRNLEPSIAVSFWWAYGWKLPLVWAAAMYKKYRSI